MNRKSSSISQQHGGFLLAFVLLFCALLAVDQEKFAADAQSSTEVIGWGDNSHLQIPVPNLENYFLNTYSSFNQPYPALCEDPSAWGNESIIEIAIGYKFTLALTSVGHLYFWGDNNDNDGTANIYPQYMNNNNDNNNNNNDNDDVSNYIENPIIINIYDDGSGNPNLGLPYGTYFKKISSMGMYAVALASKQ